MALEHKLVKATQVMDIWLDVLKKAFERGSLFFFPSPFRLFIQTGRYLDVLNGDYDAGAKSMLRSQFVHKVKDCPRSWHMPVIRYNDDPSKFSWNSVNLL